MTLSRSGGARARAARRVLALMVAATAVTSAATPTRLVAQQAQRPLRSLSLDEALRMAEAQSPTVDIARAGVARATGQRYQARSQYLPQVNGTAGYTKTLKSQFSGLSGGGAPRDTTQPVLSSVCAPNIPPNATDAERAAALAQAATCPSAGGFDFSKTGFGAKNQWTLGLQLSQNLFTGGRVIGQNQAASAQLRSANIEVAAQRAQLALDVTQAYYDAVLADQLVAIADSSLVQTREVLRQTQVARQVGNQSEFDLLRAQVTYQNQLPVLLQAQSSRQVAVLHLKQLLNVPLDDSLQLTTAIDSTGPALPPTLVRAPSDTNVSDRAPVRELEEAVRAQQGLLRVAKSERYPALSLVSGYQRLYFPTSTFPNLADARENWTVGLSTTFPIFTGGRVTGDVVVAQAALQETRARLEQTRQFAALDTRVALNALDQAEATWRASEGTAEQAQRAYSIDQVRYREGLSTQTDLSQSRLLLEQARANRARAARDLAVARMRLALLRDLPLQSSPSAAAAGSAQQQQQQQQQQLQQQQQQRSAQQSASGQSSPIGGSVQP